MQLRRSLFTVSFLIGCMPLLRAQNTTTPQYIAMYKDVAIDEMKRSGIPASITLAQGILEAQSGNSWLVQNSNNHFGIKCKNNWTGGTVYYDDDARQECFRKYNTANDSYKDHSDFLKNNPRYAFLFQFQMEDYKSWAYGLKQAGYATSKTYPTQLIKLIEDYNLQQYTLVGEGLAANTPSTATTKPATNTTSPASTAAAEKPVVNQVYDINGRKAVYVAAGTSLIQVANQKDLKLRNLVKYNDLENDDPLKKGSYLFLEKKAKSGKNDFHTVQQGETMYDISQKEGIQLRWLRRRNRMKEGEEPAPGQRLVLAGYASSKPILSQVAPVEDPTEGDLNPGQIVDDVKTEMERQQQLAQQQQAQQQQQQQPQVNKLPDGMVEDLKKMGGEVTPAGTSAAAGTTKPAATGSVKATAPTATGSVSAGAPVATAAVGASVPTATASVNTSTPKATYSTSNPAPPVATGSVNTSAPVATGTVKATMPAASGSVNASVPTATGTVKTTTPTATGSVNTTAPTATGTVNYSTPAPPVATATVNTPAPPVATGAVTAPAAPVVNASISAQAPAPPINTAAETTTPVVNASVSVPAPPVVTASAQTPAPPVVNASAPAPAATEQPATQGGIPEGTIQVGSLLYHDVITKETLYSIAKRYNVTVEQLQQWNHLDSYDIKIGQRLLVGKI